MTYAHSGVDLDAADKVVDEIQGHIRRTSGTRVLGKYGGFAGCFRLDYNEKLFQRNYRDPVLVACTDSVGAKVLLAAKLGVYDTIGQDCVAMSVNDLIVQGAEPLFFLDYIGIHKLVPELVARIVKGVSDGCQLAGCSLLGGETAELPDLYAPHDFDLAGFAVGVCELHKIIDGSRAEAGHVILGLGSSGVHSNGYSLVRAIIKEAKLQVGRVYPELNDHEPLGRVLLTPTRIYAKPIVAVLRKYKVKQPVAAMSHITGGGLPGNVPRTLGSHLNARIQQSAWPPPPIFRFLQDHGGVDEQEMWRVFNMGIGYVMIVRPHFVESIMAQLRRMGEQVTVLGKIVNGTGRLMLV